MAIWQRETDNCVGRGFDAAGFLGKFMSWITRAVSASAGGGPAWYIIDDQSALINSPYIVVCNMATPNFNTDRAKFLRLLMPSTAGRINVYHYLWWDPATHTGSTIVHYGRITTVDAGLFAYDFRGGDNGIYISSRIGSSYSRCYFGSWTGDANLVDAVTVNGTLSGGTFTESGDTGNQLSGYANMTGVRDTNTDASGKLYFSLVNTTGTTYRIDVYKDAARTAPNLVAQTATFTNTVVGVKSLNQQNSSGISGTITLDATATATTSIDCTFNRIPLGVGEGAQFTVGHYYFVYGFTSNRNLVSYVKVVGITGDTLAVDFIGAKTFLSGDVINPYPFRTWHWSTTPADPSNENTMSGNTWQIPFQSLQGGEFSAPSVPGGGAAGPIASIDYLNSIIQQGDPDDELLYYVMQPVIYEIKVTTSGFTNDGNRAYGTLNDVWVSSTASMAEGVDGKRVGSSDYLWAGNLSTTALLVLDTISTV